MNTPELGGLRAVRHQVYTVIGCRRDALFELLDAILAASSIETPAYLSLVPTGQRGWGSLYDALNAGIVELRQLEALVASYPLTTDTAWYAVDASAWLRCDSATAVTLRLRNVLASDWFRRVQRPIWTLRLAAISPSRVTPLWGRKCG